MLDGDARQVVEGASGGELPAHGIEKRGAPLARSRNPRLGADVCHQIGDDQREYEHDGEGNEVFQVADCEREARRHEAEIQHDHVRDRREARRSSAEPQRGHRGGLGQHDPGPARLALALAR